ncbi:MAG: hypothetical protein ABJD97_21245 [Betaproteobacteria bacterium]
MFTKKLAAAAAITALMTTFGAAIAQSTDQIDPMATPQTTATPQQVEVTTPSGGNQIYFFRDQGTSPETDPAAHLLLIKHEAPAPVAMDTTTTTTTTTVAQATTPAEPPAPMPAVVETAPPAADTTAMPADTTPVLAPRADRN